jgi:ATP-dependent helicase/nuclease subunit A
VTEVAAPPDADARQRAVDTLGSVLVQAPAGSGKTTLLTQRYLRLLAAVDAPERILALTFTRRAAEEMRIRVLGALEAAALPACPKDFNRRTFELAHAARRHLAALGVDVAHQPSRLRIETIDSFNAWLAAQLPISAGAGGRLALIENAKTLYEEAARRALAHEGDDAFGRAVEAVLAVGDQRWNQLRQLIVEMLPSRDRWLPLLVGRLHAASAIDTAQLERVRAHFDEDLELLVTRVLKNAYATLGAETLDELAKCLSVAARRPECQRSDLEPWALDASSLRPHPADLPRWRGLVETLLTKKQNGDLRATVDSKAGFPPGCPEKRTMIELLAQLGRTSAAVYALRAVRALPAPRYSDEDWERVRQVAQVLVLAAAQLDAVFREEGAVDFPAVSMAALRALGSDEAPTDLALRLDYRLQHLLLDEFQDTSSAQLELVRILTAGWARGDGRSVFCVGDPMQSIYGFRQAEVRAFLELAEEGIGDVRFEVERLVSNFRSEEGVVDWINRSFAEILPGSDDRERGAIAFRPSRSMRPPAASDAPAVNCRGFSSRAAEAAAIADLIAARRAEHPDWRIAVLVRGRVHAREIAHSLRNRAVAFRALDIEPLQDRPVVRDLVMLICALLHWADRIAWLALLRAPWLGLELADLLKIARAHAIVWDALRDDAVLETLSEHARLRCRRIRAVLEAGFEARMQSGVTRWVERVWIALGGPSCAGDVRELEHVRALFARLRKLEEDGLPDAADLAAHFADLYAEGDPLDAVEIMTIHKAKGLEFDCVVVPALDRHTPVYQGQLLLTHAFSREARPGMVMAARPAVGQRDNALFAFLRGQARDAASLESQRLLYVACTRAKYQLHLTATVGAAEDPDAVPGEEGDEDTERTLRPGVPRPPRTGSLLRVLWQIEPLRAQFAAPPAPAAADDDLQEADLAGLRGGPLARVPPAWSPPPIRATLAAPIDIAPEPEREETPLFDWVGETARRIGSLVHAELQLLDLAHGDETAVRARSGHFRRWLTLHGVPAERLEAACERVIGALIAVRRDPRARWIFQKGYRDDFREHALSGDWRGEVVHAVFDRSFIDEKGIRWVIDYKTSEHRGGGLEEFLEREVERYRPQLERYAALAQRLGPEPVRVGLYFPLMSAWREWVP